MATIGNPYATQAAQVAGQFGIPKGVFVSLVDHESAFNPTAKSSAGAYGLTQLMPGTAKELGVNLKNPESQLEGGAKYLKAQYEHFGSWALALAAYNAGPGAVVSGAWKTYPETTNYVKNVLGAVGKYAGVSAATVKAALAPTEETSDFNKDAFAADELSHLGNPGNALEGLAKGLFSTTLKGLPTTSPTQQGDVHAAAGAVLGKEIVKTALTQLNIPYQYGGKPGLGNHTDCSGLVQEVMAVHGISLPRTSYQQWRTGQPVPVTKLQAGDVVFFAGSDGTKTNPGHEGIYIGGGKFLDDPHTGAAVRIENLSGYPGFVGARRFTGAK